MLRPNLTTQGQFICESEEGFAFANGSLCGEFKNDGANVKPLQVRSLLIDRILFIGSAIAKSISISYC
jgi:hypothetical protein